MLVSFMSLGPLGVALGQSRHSGAWPLKLTYPAAYLGFKLSSVTILTFLFSFLQSCLLSPYLIPFFPAYCLKEGIWTKMKCVLSSILNMKFKAILKYNEDFKKNRDT